MYGKGKVVLLEDETKAQLGVSIEKLRPQSHTKILVQCTRCSEIFRREFRNLHQLHNCPTYKNINGDRYKWCNRCKEFKCVKLFQSNAARYDKLSSWCKACMQDTGATPQRIERLRLKRSTFDGWLKGLHSQKKSNCSKHNILFDITLEQLSEQWEHQNGCCYYSNVPLQFNSKSLYGAQLDKIIPSQGYTVGNVVWASKGINGLKNDATVTDLADFLSLATFDLPVRCEFFKIHEDAKLPTRSRVTDAGLDVHAIEDVTINANSFATVYTGIALVVPNGYYYTIEGRSGFWKHGIVPCRGIIDATYSGEIRIAAHNHSNQPFYINKGDRFAQLIMHKFVQADIIEVEKVDESYNDRGEDGFGSSGRT